MPSCIDCRSTEVLEEGDHCGGCWEAIGNSPSQGTATLRRHVETPHYLGQAQGRIISQVGWSRLSWQAALEARTILLNNGFYQDENGRLPLFVCWHGGSEDCRVFADVFKEVGLVRLYWKHTAFTDDDVKQAVLDRCSNIGLEGYFPFDDRPVPGILVAEATEEAYGWEEPQQEKLF